MEKRRQLVLNLLDEHGSSLHRMLGRITRCEHTAGDLLQDLFVKLVSTKGIEKADNPYAYAWRSAANLAFDHRRRKKINTAALEDAAHISGHSEPAIDKIIRNEQLEQVLDAASGLNELDRNIIYLRYVEQLTYDQIAVRLDKKASHLRSACSKAIAKLREIVSKLNSTPIEKEGSKSA